MTDARDVLGAELAEIVKRFADQIAAAETNEQLTWLGMRLASAARAAEMTEVEKASYG